MVFKGQDLGTGYPTFAGVPAGPFSFRGAFFLRTGRPTRPAPSLRAPYLGEAAGRARPMADAVRPLSTGWVETSDGEQPPSWIPHPSATQPVPPTHATAFSKSPIRVQD